MKNEREYRQTMRFRIQGNRMCKSEHEKGAGGGSDRASEETHGDRLFNELLESVYDAVFITTAEGSILRQNQRARRRFHIDDGDIIAMNILQLILGSTPDHLKTIQNQLVHHGRVCIEASCMSGTGEQFPAEITVNLIDYSGTSEGELCFFVRDISARHEAEEELTKERYLMTQLMERSPDYIYFKDRNGAFLRVNKNWAAHVGLQDPDDALGKTDFDFHDKEHSEDARTDEEQVIASGEPMRNKTERLVLLGKEMWISTTKCPLLDPEGHIVGTFGISRDITEQKCAEQELASKNIQLESDLRMAREIQQAFLDHEVPTFPSGSSIQDSALRFYRHYVPTGAIGGDFYNIKPLTEHTVGIFICDVMGHDVRSALVMASLHGLSEKLEFHADNPGMFLTEMNQSLRGILESAEALVFASAFYCTIDISRGLIHFANAGHPWPLYLHPELNEVRPLGDAPAQKGPALGLFSDVAYATSSVSVPAGTLITMFTDGLFEVHDDEGKAFGLRRLREFLYEYRGSDPSVFYAELIRAVKNYSSSAHFEDDVCLVGAKLQRLL